MLINVNHRVEQEAIMTTATANDVKLTDELERRLIQREVAGGGDDAAAPGSVFLMQLVVGALLLRGMSTMNAYQRNGYEAFK